MIHMDFSENIFSLLAKMNERPMMFLEDKSLKKLYYFLCGYLAGWQAATGKRLYFQNRFQDFIEARYPSIEEEYDTQNWYNILSQNYVGEETFSVFFREMELFRKIVGTGPDSLLYSAPERSDWAVIAVKNLCE